MYGKCASLESLASSGGKSAETLDRELIQNCVKWSGHEQQFHGSRKQRKLLSVKKQNKQDMETCRLLSWCVGPNGRLENPKLGIQGAEMNVGEKCMQCV